MACFRCIGQQIEEMWKWHTESNRNIALFLRANRKCACAQVNFLLATASE